MKIFDYALPKNLNVSAVCIIENGTLGKKLRSIENPQHTAWESKRLEQPERTQIDTVIKNIKSQIEDYVFQCFKTTTQTVIDPYGAGEFWAAANDDGGHGGEDSDQSQQQKETVEISEFKPAVVVEKKCDCRKR